MSRGAAAAALQGARECLPVAISVVAYGLVFGVLARQKGLGPFEVLLMSGTVFSGTAQFVALDLWSPPLPVWPIVLAALIVSLRYVLICASVQPLFARLGLARALPAMFLVTDENWAVSMSRGRGAAHILGGGALLYVGWCLATAAGSAIGTVVADPKRWGLDFAFTATFLALLIGMWRGRGDLLPWAVAAATATAASLLLPGKWYILIGGLVGSLCGILRDDQ